eukprot:scaffold174872_cov17-Tisochrysis_lutea.AAC.1
MPPVATTAAAAAGGALGAHGRSISSNGFMELATATRIMELPPLKVRLLVGAFVFEDGLGVRVCTAAMSSWTSRLPQSFARMHVCVSACYQGGEGMFVGAGVRVWGAGASADHGIKAACFCLVS